MANNGYLQTVIVLSGGLSHEREVSLRSGRRVSQALGGETDLVLVTTMQFDDPAALDAGLASDAMRAAGRNLREIAPGLATLLVLEDADDLVR